MFFCCCTSAEVETTTTELVESALAVTDNSHDTDEQTLAGLTAQAVSEEEEEPSFFKCKVKRDDGPWGLSLDWWDDCIQIIDVKDGRIQEYNNSVGDEKKLCRGDFIMQVDGQDVTKETVAALKPMTEVDFSIARPTLLRARIEQGMKLDGTSWGLQLNHHKARSNCLRVGKIKEGGIAEFNKVAEVPVREKDFIVEVNGCRDDPNAMTEIFKSSDELNLTLMRLP